MAKNVEFTNARVFEEEVRRMPLLALHELAHAYHDRFLLGGHQNPEIAAAFEKAKASGLYDRVERRDANGNTVRTAFRDAFEHGGLFLFDEVDASSPQALLCINAAIANGYCDFPEGRIKAHKDFRFIAAANTNGGGATREYSGRNQLDAATLDRFATFACEYDDALVAKLVGAYDLPEPLKAKALEWNQRVCDYRKALSKCGLRGVISPRCSLNGAKLIAAGFDFPQLAEVLVLNKFANPDDRKRLQAEAKAITEARTAPKPTPAV
jgi:hypothetical protein